MVSTSGDVLVRPSILSCFRGNKKICMNAACGAMTSIEWKKGWDLRSGGFATLCFNCGNEPDRISRMHCKGCQFLPSSFIPSTL